MRHPTLQRASFRRSAAPRLKGSWPDVANLKDVAGDLEDGAVGHERAVLPDRATLVDLVHVYGSPAILQGVRLSLWR